METDLKVLVFRNRDNKKNAEGKRNVLRRIATGKQGIIIAAVAVVLIVAAACSDVFGFVGHGASAAEEQTVETEGLNEAVQAEAAQNSAEEAEGSIAQTADGAQAIADASESEKTEAGKTVIGPVDIRKAADKFAAETAKKAMSADIKLLSAPYAINFGLNANRSIRLLSEGEEEEFIFFPADLGSNKDSETEMELSDAIAAGNTAGTDSDSAQENDAADATADGSKTRMDEIEEKVDSLPDPEDVPTKLTYRFNPDMMIEQTAENIEVLERIVEAEATDQDIYGRMLVANVVINRVHSKYFKNTVKGVVFETIGGYEQFAPIRDGRYFTVPITEKTREAVRRVLAGEDYSDGALYFFQRDITTDKKAAWFDNNLKYLFKYGCHEFYTEFSEYNKKNK
ncbi:MAG: cell wall hydrolase [Lachnospiraceae bacterium]|nr:cell wall hydrolase [Lachnospiraceae bacterium]